MTKKYIYLAGPIGGCDKGEATNWRDDVCNNLVSGIVGISPLRCEPLINSRYDNEAAFADGDKDQTKDKRFGTAAAIAGKNWLDTVSCDLVLMYLPRELTERRPSYGTIIELGWAIALRKPVIIVTDDPSIAHHPIITENVSWIFDNMDDALDTIHGLFEDYVDG